MPAELREHLRYPEDLFRVQTDVYSKYQLDAGDFFERDGRLVGGPGAERRSPRSRRRGRARRRRRRRATSRRRRSWPSESSTSRFIPYYTMFGAAAGRAATSSCCCARSCRSRANDQRTELQAYMTASSDPDDVRPADRLRRRAATLPDGPRTRGQPDRLRAAIAQQITLQTRRRQPRCASATCSSIPVGDGLLYVRPFYVAVPQSSDRTTTVTEYRFVIVSYNDRAAFGESLGEALAKLFPASRATSATASAPRRAEPGGGRRPPPGPARPSEHAGRAARPGRPAVRRRRCWRSRRATSPATRTNVEAAEALDRPGHWTCSTRRRVSSVAERA